MEERRETEVRKGLTKAQKTRAEASRAAAYKKGEGRRKVAAQTRLDLKRWTVGALENSKVEAEKRGVAKKDREQAVDTARLKKLQQEERGKKNWLAKQVEGLVDRRAQARGGEVQAVVRESTVVVNRVEKCKHPQCKLCETVNTSRFVESSWRRVKYEVTDYEKRDRLVVCKEEWVVYVATC